MNDHPRSLEPQNSLLDTRFSSVQTGKKAAIYFLAILIASTIIVWFGFLGWGLLAMLQWLLDCIKSLSIK